MPKIIEEHPYDGAHARIERLGLGSLVTELKAILTGFELLVEEKKDSNGGKAVREFLDDRFKNCGGWSKKQTGDIDWEKCHKVNGTKVCIGVEIQVSGRSDAGLFADIAHLRRAFSTGRIDVGVIVVPSDKLGYFLTDRAPTMSAAKRHIEEARAFDLPIILFAIEQDGPGEKLKKQTKKKMPIEE